MSSPISLRSLLLPLLTVALLPQLSRAQTPIPVAIVGLVHGHVQGFLAQLPKHPEVKLLGISEPDAALRQRYASKFGFPESMFFPTEAAMLEHTHPQAVLVYTSIAGHRAAIETAADRGIASMVEKPLATTVEDALAIERASAQHHVPVLTNYETTWYASNTAAASLLASGRIGDLRKIVVHDGHKGPKEIGVGPEFLGWLTDPAQNGAGALFDFGCYGVDLTTWIQHGELPLTVSAVTLHIKPEIYPKVDDDSTIVLTYPHAQAIIQGSWNWPFDRKDMEIYGATGYVDTLYESRAPGAKLRVRLPGDAEEKVETAPPLTAPNTDSLSYLVAVLEHKPLPKDDLNALETNIKVVRILSAARESARTGRTLHLDPATKAYKP